MPVNNEKQSILAREIRIVPVWAWTLGGIAFIAAQLFLNIAVAHHKDAPPAWARPLIGLIAGLGACVFLALIGYVNRDAKRRGMSPTLWTIVALIIPNALGILLFFVLRQPLQSTCPQCRNSVQAGFTFCPRCSYRIGPSCPQCKRAVGADDLYCPYCGTALQNQAAPLSGDPAGLPG